MKADMINEQLAISKSDPLKARFYDYKHFSYPWHFHSEYEIIYIKKGSGMRCVGNHIDPFNDGDIVLIGSNLPHFMKSAEIYHDKNSRLRVKGTIIQFEKEFMQHSISHYPHFNKVKRLFEEAKYGICFPAGCSAKLGKLLDTIPRESGMTQMISFLQLLKIMAETSDRKIVSTSDYVNDWVYDGSRIDKITSYLNKNYTHPIHLKEIASLAAMNPSAFCRFFKSKTRKSLKQYILDMRINHACKLLSMNDVLISQISEECGFETVSYFNKVFKQNTGHT
ncbi:AraC family transcriptional regulator, partial [Parabacteroides sp. OttesenSCG-928-O15]|nr:AraC family transcriptional regulator [Parabacteroides sp. OttesenSCG-928-O15]